MALAAGCGPQAEWPGEFGPAVIGRPISLHGAGMGRTVLRGEITIGGTGEVHVQDLTVVGEGGGTGIGGESVGFTVTRCEVRNFRWGIGAYGSRGTLVVRDSLITGNLQGIDFGEAGADIINNVVTHNSRSGIVARSFMGGRFLHNTVVGNAFAGDPDAGGGGITLGPFGNVTAYNNIIVGNKYGLSCLRCRQRCGNNLVWGNVENYVRSAGPGDGDVRSDPRFVDPGEGDYRLSADSPAIDAARDVGEALDAAGAPRAGEGPDIGAFEFGVAAPALVINEVMANPLVERSGEFIELINISDQPVDVAGHWIDDGDTRDEIIAAGGGTVLAAGAIAVVLDRDYADDHDIPDAALRLSVADARLGNSLSVGDPVRLLAPDGVTAVSGYSHPFDPGNGISAERRTPEAEDLAASWVSSPCGGTPGRVNCTVEPPQEEPVRSLTITEVMANPLDERTGEFVELLNTGNEAIDMTTLVLSDGDADDPLPAAGGGGGVLEAGAYAVVLDRDYADQYDIPDQALRLTVADARPGNALATSDPITVRDADGGRWPRTAGPSTRATGARRGWTGWCSSSAGCGPTPGRRSW